MDEMMLNGRYQLVELVGSGGMAVVYKGMDTLLHRPVAIKLLRETYSGDEIFLARFLQEARSAARLDHPNVVTIYDVGQDGNRHYIVMEYVDGEDLKTLIRREGRMGVDTAISIATQIAAGVGHAHKAGIIHCDVKPQNVLLTKEGTAKVADFGIARALSESGLTDSEVVWGSPLYFAPEQAAGERPTPASDVYSIGVVLFEMLAGEPPFQAEKPTALALMHIREEPPPISTKNPHVPPQLEWIVRKVLAKEPSARYRTAEQLGTVLQEYRAHGEQSTSLYTPASLPVVATGAEQAPPSPARSPTAPLTQEYATGPDWVTWILGAVAAVAVIGLIPLWALVYQAWSHSSDPGGTTALNTPVATVATVRVPDVVGEHWEEARTELERVGLRFALEEEPGATLPEGTIVRQVPSPGEMAEVGTEIALYIAGPPASVAMANLVNVQANMARDWLEQAGLQVVEDIVWSTQPISTVIAQVPEQGAIVQAGSVATLTVSGGTTVPIEVQAHFGELILLEKIELRQVSFRPGDLVSISLRWQAMTTVSSRYVVFIHLIGPSGELVAQQDIEPLQGSRPTDTWSPEVPLWDSHQIQIPANAPTGSYQIRVGMYPPGQPSERLPVTNPGEATVTADSLHVANIDVRP